VKTTTSILQRANIANEPEKMKLITSWPSSLQIIEVLTDQTKISRKLSSSLIVLGFRIGHIEIKLVGAFILFLFV